MQKLLIDEFNKININLTQKQIQMFCDYYDLLIEYNNKINLTSIIEKKEVVIKHFIDSCLGISLIKDNASIIDIGSGAGFPSFPLKIIKDNIKLTIVDSLKKRIDFLSVVVDKLKLENVELFHNRAEDFLKIKENREKFDYCVVRAVAKQYTLNEICLPAVKIGGCLLSYKSGDIKNEIDISSYSAKILGANLKNMYNFVLPDNMGNRTIIEYSKFTISNLKYPRGKNLPKDKPLILNN